MRALVNRHGVYERCIQQKKALYPAKKRRVTAIWKQKNEHKKRARNFSEYARTNFGT